MKLLFFLTFAGALFISKEVGYLCYKLLLEMLSYFVRPEPKDIQFKVIRIIIKKMSEEK